jgi:hypothetical protein
MARFYGKPGWYVGLIAPLCIIFSPLIIYLQYLGGMLYDMILAIESWTTGNEIEIKEGVHFNELS